MELALPFLEDIELNHQPRKLTEVICVSFEYHIEFHASSYHLLQSWLPGETGTMVESLDVLP